ncbi:MAG: DsbA family oxidoreductase [Cyanobacteria bacterium P01_C01_bin.72]
MTLRIEITSDFICPWCFVAETRLNKAIARLGSDIEIEKIWHPYELNPTMPEGGMNRQVYRSTKFGSWEYSQQLDRHTIEATKNDGIDFRYDLMEFTPNTLKAHRLTWYASQHGKGTQIAERIFNAYFTEGQNISEVETLASLADEIGIDATTAQEFLLSEAGVAEVKELERQAISLGVAGVPNIKIGNETISGAQYTKEFLAALKRAIKLAEV